MTRAITTSRLEIIGVPSAAPRESELPIPFHPAGPSVLVDPGDRLVGFGPTIEGGPKNTRYQCFAGSEVADQLEEWPEGVLLSGTLVCLGQMKVFTCDLVMDWDDGRGVEYPVAWLLKSVMRA
jgi:hypothetical protein